MAIEEVFHMIKEAIKKRVEKMYSVCGEQIKVLIYKDRTYRGGHYFFKIKDAEYWECPKCYWGK